MPFLSFAQGDEGTYILHKLNGQYKISDSVTVASSFTKKHLYNNSRNYFSDAKSAHIDSLIYNDNEMTLLGQSSFDFKKWNQTIVNWYTNKFKIEFKTEIVSMDGQYHYLFYDIIVYQLTSSGSMYGPLRNVQWKMDDIDLMTKKGTQKKFYQRVRTETDNLFKNAVVELKACMSK